MDALLETLRAAAKIVTIGAEDDPFADPPPVTDPGAASPTAPDAS